MVPPYCGAVLGLVAWRVAASSAPNEKHIYQVVIVVDSEIYGKEILNCTIDMVGTLG